MGYSQGFCYSAIAPPLLSELEGEGFGRPGPPARARKTKVTNVPHNSRDPYGRIFGTVCVQTGYLTSQLREC